MRVRFLNLNYGFLNEVSQMQKKNTKSIFDFVFFLVKK